MARQHTPKLTMKKTKLQNKSKTKKKHKQPAQEEEAQSRTNPAEFSFAVIRVAVSQICRWVGFGAAEGSALETLTLVATKYLQELAQLAASYSHASNRTDSNIFDLINALQDLCLIPSAGGFAGASALPNGDNCLLSSSALKDVSRFVKYSDEIPFAKPLPRENRLLSSNGLGNKERRVSAHIPKWLPGFPDERTYKECGKSVYRRGGELWENSEAVKSSCSGGGVREERMSSDLGRERGKVRFRIGFGGKGEGGKEESGGIVGVDMRNGVCRGGKRVRWNGTDEDDKNIGFGFKRRKRSFVFSL